MLPLYTNTKGKNLKKFAFQISGNVPIGIPNDETLTD